MSQRSVGLIQASFSACVALIVRVTSFSQVKFDDMTYTIVPASYWTTVEQSVGNICGCLVTLRKYLVSYSSNSNGSEKLHLISYVKAGQTPISLADMKYRQAGNNPSSNSRAAFVHLDEGTGKGDHYLGTAFMAAKAHQEDLPVVPKSIYRRQDIEQHVDAV